MEIFRKFFHSSGEKVSFVAWRQDTRLEAVVSASLVDLKATQPEDSNQGVTE